MLRKDLVLRPVLQEELPPVTPRPVLYLALIESILGQQLSIKVAAIIRERFYALFATETPSVQDILDLDTELLRSIGLSRQKTGYVQAVARFWAHEKVDEARLRRQAPEEIIALLTQIKGVGRWTVEMLLMFAMGHEDVFAPDDLGIQQAMIRLYALADLPKKELLLKMKEISVQWAPYRSFACRHLWRWKDA